MTIDELKELERKHGSGWRFQDNTDDKSVSEEVVFLNAFLHLRKEFLALWEAHNNRLCASSDQEWDDAGDAMEDALNALNLKAASMDA